MLDVARLRVLAAVAETGSVSAAARVLHYSQPSVSHHLARLEAETGAVLLRRAGRGIALTAEGELLARRAREIVGRVEAADAELTAALGRNAGRLRVSAFQSALSMLVPCAAAAVRTMQPNLDLRLTDVHPVHALQQLRDGAADVAIVFRYDDVLPEDGIRYVQLLEDPVYLLSQTRGQTLAEHRDSPWIAGCTQCRAELVELCETVGFTPRIAYTSEDVVVDQALVAAGLGVTTMPGLALRSFRRDDLEATEIDRRRRVLVAVVGDAPDPPIAAAFVAALHDAASSL